MSVEVLQPDAKSALEGHARFGDLAEELWVMLQPILEPIIFRLKADKDTRWSAVPSNDDFFIGR